MFDDPDSVDFDSILFNNTINQNSPVINNLVFSFQNFGESLDTISESLNLITKNIHYLSFGTGYNEYSRNKEYNNILKMKIEGENEHN